MSRVAYWGLFAALLVALAGAAYLTLQRDPDLSADSPDVVSPDPVITVDAERVTLDTVQEAVRAVGTLRPNESVTIAPEIAGRVERLDFAEGGEATAGQVLVALDSAILRAELTKTQSDLALARVNRERLATLAERGTGSLRALDEAVASLRAAEAAAALAQLRLEKSELRAPFAGIVGVRTVSVGAYVIPGQRIVEIVATDPIKVEFRVPELALPRIKVGQSVRVLVDALPEETFLGEIHVVDPLVDDMGRSGRLRALISNPDRRLSPGLFARVEVMVGRSENAVFVPESAVFSRGQARYAFRVVGGRVKQTLLELGQRRPGMVEVIDGLDADAVVVTAGQQKLRDGSRVRVRGSTVHEIQDH